MKKILFNMIIIAGVILLTSCTKEVDVSGKIIYKYIEKSYDYVDEIRISATYNLIEESYYDYADEIRTYQPATYNLITVDTTNHTTYKASVDSVSYFRYENGNYYQGKKCEFQSWVAVLFFTLIIYLPRFLYWLDNDILTVFAYIIDFSFLMPVVLALMCICGGF
jgi:hypothetical protein